MLNEHSNLYKLTSCDSDKREDELAVSAVALLLSGGTPSDFIGMEELLDDSTEALNKTADCTLFTWSHNCDQSSRFKSDINFRSIDSGLKGKLFEKNTQNTWKTYFRVSYFCEETSKTSF